MITKPWACAILMVALYATMVTMVVMTHSPWFLLLIIPMARLVIEIRRP